MLEDLTRWRRTTASFNTAVMTIPAGHAGASATSPTSASSPTASSQKYTSLLSEFPPSTSTATLSKPRSRKPKPLLSLDSPSLPKSSVLGPGGNLQLNWDLKLSPLADSFAAESTSALTSAGLLTPQKSSFGLGLEESFSRISGDSPLLVSSSSADQPRQTLALSNGNGSLTSYRVSYSGAPSGGVRIHSSEHIAPLTANAIVSPFLSRVDSLNAPPQQAVAWSVFESQIASPVSTLNGDNSSTAVAATATKTYRDPQDSHSRNGLLETAQKALSTAPSSTTTIAAAVAGSTGADGAGSRTYLPQTNISASTESGTHPDSQSGRNLKENNSGTNSFTYSNTKTNTSIANSYHTKIKPAVATAILGTANIDIATALLATNPADHSLPSHSCPPVTSPPIAASIFDNETSFLESATEPEPENGDDIAAVDSDTAELCDDNDHRPVAAATRGGASDKPSLSSVRTRMSTSSREHDYRDFSRQSSQPPQPRDRDSHDLSLPSRNVTRDSLMANMLISLDQFSSITSPHSASLSTQHIHSHNPLASSFDDLSPSAPFDDRAWTSASSAAATTAAVITQAQGHRNRTRSNTDGGNSYSSDFDIPNDSSRISSRAGRRSNSSSNYYYPPPAAGIGRMNSLRSQPTTPRHAIHSRSRRGSKSSSLNSFDGAFVSSSQPPTALWVQNQAAVSSANLAFRNNTELNPTTSPQSTATQFVQQQILREREREHQFILQQQTETPQYAQARGIACIVGRKTSWQADLNSSYLDDEFEAAPPPEIPGGPPLDKSSSRPHPPPPPPPESKNNATLEHKRSTQSAKSISTSKHRDSSRSQQIQQPHYDTSAMEIDSAPSPHVGYEKSKENNGQGPNSSNKQEKQGFFRRVFGSRTASSTNISESAAPIPTDIPDRRKSQSTPPSRDSAQPYHVLQKKTSTFFRRRKKSFNDADAPPMPQPPPMPNVLASPTSSSLPPTNAITGPETSSASTGSLLGSSSMPALPPPKTSAVPEPSPVNSLRKVTSPYIKGASGPATVSPGGGSMDLNECRTPSTPERPPVNRHRSTNPNDPGFKRSFSPEYDPSPSAVIRRVERDNDSVYSSASENAYNNNQSGGHSRGQQSTSTRDISNTTKPSNGRTNSFLNLDPPSDGEIGSWTNKVQKTTGTDRHPSGQRSRGASRSQGRRAIMDSDDDKRHSVLLPIEGIRQDGTEEVMGSSMMNIPRIIGGDEKNPSIDPKNIDEPDSFVIGDPTEDDRKKAQRIFGSDETFISREKAAAWMGEEGPVRQRVLRAYMELFDFKNTNIVESLRSVCSRLIFRAETQQVDRILVCFSNRWAECNPNHGFKTIDVIHCVCYSIFLLNTDLHMADIEQKMTRPQFVRNTMETIRQAIEESDHSFYDGNGLNIKTRESGYRTSHGPSKRSSFLPLRGADNHAMSDLTDMNECGPLVKAPFEGTMKAWESVIEIVLKEIYVSIRDDRLPLMGRAESDRNLTASGSQNNLSVMGMLKRSPSVLSKTPSESQASLRGRITDSRNSSSRWASKSRSRPRFGTPGFSSSRTSFDDQNSVWSPSASSTTWSKQSLGRTQTSMSMDSFGSGFARSDLQQSIGFANALSQAIIRDDLNGNASIVSDDMKTNLPLLDDESLELAGPPWVKEGLVSHKHHLDGVDKKAKDRNWSEVFAVVQKGTLNIFSFQPNKSVRNRRRNKGGPITVGGGNWQDNATNLGTFDLRQTLASTLPPPGYSRTRPHVWALSLPTGAVHLFQAGTPELVKEFVTSVNYWSARLSTHPLIGGISNIEYGWSSSIINNSLVTAITESTAGAPASLKTTSATKDASIGIYSRPGSSTTGHGRNTSVAGSVRSGRSASFDHGFGSSVSGSGRGKLPGDKVHITDWSPSTQSMRPSTLGESEQLTSLQNYVRGIEAELQMHNQLRSPMLLAYTPHSSNAAKAMANWERKSAYLLREIVKFRTYVDCLTQAETRRLEIYHEREHARRAARGDIDLSDSEIEDDDTHTEGEADRE